jgi:hypothetical protein
MKLKIECCMYGIYIYLHVHAYQCKKSKEKKRSLATSIYNLNVLVIKRIIYISQQVHIIIDSYNLHVL